MARSLIGLASVVFALGAVALAGCDNAPDAAISASEGSPPSVTVAQVKSEDLRATITFTGRIEAIAKVDLRARVQGFLEEQLFTEGQDVKKGDLLFVIEKAPYQTSVAQAQAVVASTQAALKRAQIEFDRQSTLVKQNVAAKAKLEDATVMRDESKADLAQSQAALQKAELDLSYTDVLAPIDGRIGRATYSIGSFVEPASGVLATIVSQDPIYVTFPITQREVLELQQRLGGNLKARDADMRIQLADGSRYEHPGKVNFIDVTANQGTDSVLVRASFPNPDRFLVDGQLVSVIAEAGNAEPTLTVQQSALQADQAGIFVLIVNKESKIEVRRVETGPSKGEMVSIVKGLAEGDMVVTKGIQKVRPGQIVSSSEAN